MLYNQLFYTTIEATRLVILVSRVRGKVGCHRLLYELGMGYEYMTATNKVELNEALLVFVSPDHEEPVILEVFTKMKEDGEHTLSVHQSLEKCIKPIMEG